VFALYGLPAQNSVADCPLARHAFTRAVHFASVVMPRNLRRADRVGHHGVPPETPAKAPKRPEDWSAEERLRAVMESSRLTEAELGAFLRREGLHEATLRQWRASALEGLGPQRATRSEQKRLQELEKELRRKDKALAEAAALLVLQKKVRALWGDGDDDTEPKNEK